GAGRLDTPLQRFAPPPHSVGRSYARPALRATSPLCGEELRPSGASRHLPTLWGGVTPLRRFAPPPHSVWRSYAAPALRATSGGVSLRSGRSPPLTGRDHLLHVLLDQGFDVLQDRDGHLGVVLGQIGHALDRLQDLDVLTVGLVRLRRGM